MQKKPIGNWNEYALPALIPLLVWLFLQACASERREGCLDFRYSNFSVGAEVGCPNCCKPPEVRILLRHRYSLGDSLQPLDLFPRFYLPVGAPDSLSLEGLSYILSDFQLVDWQGRVIPALDSLTIRKLNSQKDSLLLTFANSFLVGNPAVFLNRRVGTILHNGVAIRSLRFQFGVSSSVNALQPSDFPASHPLAPGQGTLHQAGSGFTFASMSLKRKSGHLTTSQTLVLNGEASRILVEIPTVLSLRAGYHQEITLDVNIASWLGQMDFSQPPEVTKRRWMAGIPGSFRVAAVNERLD